MNQIPSALGLALLVTMTTACQPRSATTDGATRIAEFEQALDEVTTLMESHAATVATTSDRDATETTFLDEAVPAFEALEHTAEDLTACTGMDAEAPVHPDVLSEMWIAMADAVAAHPGAISDAASAADEEASFQDVFNTHHDHAMTFEEDFHAHVTGGEISCSGDHDG